MTELAVASLGTIVRLGEALPVVFCSSAVDFILPVNCRRSTTAVRAASGTAGKMNSPEAEPRHAGRHAAGGAACRGHFFRLGTEQVRSLVQSGVAGGHAKWFRALPAVAPPRRRSVTECRPMTPGAGPSAETECEANARAPQARHSSATAC